MSDSTCPYEAAVVEAARTGEWVNGLRPHVHRCAECADSARVTAWIGDVAAQLGCHQSARDPTYIWLRAEIERRAKEESASTLRRSGIAAVLALTVAGGSAAAMLAALPPLAGVAITARTWLSSALAEIPLVDMALISSGWLGLSLLLAATYLLVLRPLR
jgi:hypothetical protein